MNMVEKVAKNIYEDRNGHGCVPWSRRSGDHKAPYLSDARAAIKAMREPTEKMIEAAEGMSVGGPYLGPLDADAIYESMIDAALSE